MICVKINGNGNYMLKEIIYKEDNMEKYKQEYQRWLDNLKNSGEIDNLKALNEEEIRDAFYQTITFGTAGMRGKMGLGTNRMNVYTLRRANYGYAKFLKDTYGDNLSVVIARDNRRNGEDYVKECVKVLATFGIKSYIFNGITPTPVLSYAVRYLKCSGGIVVTASHNNKDYNGYKIYDNEGCQLVPSLASQVVENVANAPDYFDIEVKDFDEVLKLGLVEYLTDEVEDSYLDKVFRLRINANVRKDDFRICYTPLHGTGGKLATKLFDTLGYKYVKVEEQFVNDPDFTTVPYPNPEDPKAFTLALEYAKKEDCDIIIATDPDADRIGVAVREKNGKYRLLTGNETGAILIYYICTNDMILKDSYIIDTIVTSRLGRRIAEKFGFKTLQTFTGFKFIGQQITKLENDNKKFKFGYEEAFGYTLGTIGRDKDSLQGILIAAEAANYYKMRSKKTLVDILGFLDRSFGYYRASQNTLILEGEKGQKQIKQVMEYLRKHDIDSFGKFKVLEKIDYNQSDYIVNDINLGRSDVIEYDFGNDNYCLFRPSGTEPKLKCYIGTTGTSEADSNKKTAEIKKAVDEIYSKVIK